MGLFRRDADPQKELARAIAARGVRTIATVETMHPSAAEVPTTGAEVDFSLSFDPAGRVQVRQAMNHSTLAGVEPGEPVWISYDSEDPARVVIWGSPKYRTAEPGVPVPVPEAEWKRVVAEAQASQNS